MYLRQTWQSGFLRSVAVLSGGSGVAMAVPILAAPLLWRLYMPAGYGALATCLADTSRRDAAGARAQKLVADNYSWAAIAERMARVYAGDTQ